MARRYGALEKQRLLDVALPGVIFLRFLQTANSGSVSHQPESQCLAMPAVGEQDGRAETIPSPKNSYMSPQAKAGVTSGEREGEINT